MNLHRSLQESTRSIFSLCGKILTHHDYYQVFLMVSIKMDVKNLIFILILIKTKLSM